MKKDEFSALFHGLLGDLSVIRNALHFLLMGKVFQPNQEAKHYLEESLKKCDDSVKKIIALRKKLELKG